MKKFITLLLLICLCACSTEEKVYTKDSHYYTTTLTKDDEMVLLLNTDVVLTTVDAAKREAMISDAYDLLLIYHRLLDSHHEYSDANNQTINNLKIVNDSYGTNKAITVSPLILDALGFAIEMSELTKGYFNPTLGSLSELWSPLFSNTGTTNEPPGDAEIEKAKACIYPYQKLNDYISLDYENNTVALKKLAGCESSVQIDLGALSKGYIADKVADLLKEKESSFLFNAGSSSIVTYNQEAEGISWNVGIRSPFDGSMLTAIKAQNITMSSSADDQRYFLKENEDGTLRIYHHILNPYSGSSENYFRGITLVSTTNAGVLDALSTALYSIENEEERNAIITDIEKEFNMEILKAYIYEENNQSIFEIDQKLSEMYSDGYEVSGVDEVRISEE